MTLLEIAGLQVRYGPVPALQGVSLAVAEGEVVALLGANGAGKTTTLRTVSGLLRPYAGTIAFAGRPVHGLPPHEVAALGVAHVPEGRRVFPHLSVQENLEMGGYRRRGPLRSDLDRVLEVFPDLAGRRAQPAGTLSGGQQQMLALGRALMGRPRLLLLDEPSMGLAPQVVAEVFAVVAALNAEGTTVLLVEQNAAQALALAHRGYVLETGRLVAEGSAVDLRADPRVRAAYLGAGAA